MKVALIYVRQSRTDEGSVSLDVQEAACRRLAEVAQCENVEVFRDEDTSGGTDKRPQYQAMLRRIVDAKSQQEIAVVSAYDLSCIARDAEVLLAFHRLMTGEALDRSAICRWNAIWEKRHGTRDLRDVLGLRGVASKPNKREDSGGPCASQ